VKLGEYYTMPDDDNVTRETVLRPDEILTQVTFPMPAAGTRSTYIKFKERSSYDFALASVALVARLEGGVIRDARLVLGGVAPVPWRSTKAEAALVGKKPDEAAGLAAAELALEGAEALEHNGYKIPLAKALVVRAVQSLAQGA
jgi:xanthine dehydrogenase YagS FAD-binding subunit